jgi:molybdate/tungstate transport system ATP-binding protein
MQRLLWSQAGASLPVQTTLADGAQVDWHVAPEAVVLHGVGSAPVDAIAAGVELRQTGAHGRQVGLRCGQARLWASLPSGDLAATVRLSLPSAAIRCWPV